MKCTRVKSKSTIKINFDANISDVAKFTCPILRAYLRSKGLDSTGKKNELVNRVFSQLVKEKIQKAVTLPGANKCISRPRTPITGLQLYDAVHQFETKDPRDFSVEELKATIDIMGPTSYIDMRGATEKALNTVETFYRPWLTFVEEYPELKEALDPHFVVFNFGTLGATPPNGPPGWSGSLLALPATLGVLPIAPVAVPVPAPGAAPGAAPAPVPCEYFYQVNGPIENQCARARHLGGFMQGRHPGLSFWEFALPGPPLYW